MVLNFQDQSGLGEGISKAGNAIEQAFKQRTENRKQSLIQQMFAQQNNAKSDKIPKADTVLNEVIDQQGMNTGLQGSDEPKSLDEIINEVEITGEQRPDFNPAVPTMLLSLDKSGKSSQVASEQQKQSQKNYQNERDFQTKQSSKLVEKNAESVGSIRTLESSINNMESALADGDLAGFFTGDNLARITGIGAFKTMKGGVLGAALKEGLISTIGELAGRPNMWIEQQVKSMFADIGDSKWAQLGAMEVFKEDVALRKLKAETFEKLETRYRNELGYVKPDIEAQVNKIIGPEVDKIRAQTAFNLRNIYEDEKGDAKLKKAAGNGDIKKVTKVVQGTPLTPRMSSIIYNSTGKDIKKSDAIAKKMGFVIPE